MGWVLLQQGPWFLALVFALLFGGVALVLLSMPYRSVFGPKWAAGTPTRLVLATRKGMAALPWTTFCEEVRWRGAERGDVSFRIRPHTGAKEELGRLGLLDTRPSVIGRDRSVPRQGIDGRDDRLVQRELLVTLAGVRDPRALAAASAAALGKPAQPPSGLAASPSVATPSPPAFVSDALAGVKPDFLVRSQLPWGARTKSSLLALGLLGGAALFLVLLAWFGREARGGAEGGEIAAMTFFVVVILALTYAGVVNLRAALQPGPWVAGAWDGLRVVEGRWARWVAWSRFQRDVRLQPDGSLALRLDRADHDRLAAMLDDETVSLRGIPQPKEVGRLLAERIVAANPADPAPERPGSPPRDAPRA